MNNRDVLIAQLQVFAKSTIARMVQEGKIQADQADTALDFFALGLVAGVDAAVHATLAVIIEDDDKPDYTVN